MVGGRREENWNEEIDEDGGREAKGLWWLRSRAEEIDGEVYGQSDGEICSKGKGKSEQEDRRGDRRGDLHPEHRRDLHPEQRRDLHPEHRRDLHPEHRREERQGQREERARRAASRPTRVGGDPRVRDQTDSWTRGI